jgi:MoxR-like ATPase
VLWQVVGEGEISFVVGRGLVGLLERHLLRVRRQKLDEMKGGVSGTGFSQEMAKYVERLVYSTWSREAAENTVPGLSDLVPTYRRIHEALAVTTHGSSPRGGQALRDLACAVAWARGRDEVERKDVDLVAGYVLGHRIGLRPQATRGDGTGPSRIVEFIIGQIRAEEK